MNTDQVTQAVRQYIDSIKGNPGYSVEMDDFILDAWIKGMSYERKWLNKELFGRKHRE